MRKAQAALLGWVWLAGCSSEPAPTMQDCPSADRAGASTDPPFAPAEQTPLFDKGLILPELSLPCVPVSTGTPQNECNHHGSTVAQLLDGRIAVTWYHGEEEKSLDSRVIWSTRDSSSGNWSAPELVYDEPDLAEGNPALWVHEDGELFVFFVTIIGGGWHESNVRLTRSQDQGKTWSEAITLRDEYCWNARHRPLRLDDGQLLLPLYQECMATPAFMRSSDDFATWEQDPEILDLAFISQIQPALIHGPDGSVLAITRDGSLVSRIRRIRSTDAGKTWSPPELLQLPNSGTSVDWVRLANGHVVVVFNNDPDRRFPLSVALSYDDGDRFVAVRDLNAECEDGSCSYHYPSIMQAADGNLWVSYTHNRETIGWVHFNEAWLAAGEAEAQIRCGATEACVEGSCFAACGGDADCASDQSCLDGACRRPCDGGAGCSAGLCAHPSKARCSES